MAAAGGSRLVGRCLRARRRACSGGGVSVAPGSNPYRPAVPATPSTRGPRSPAAIMRGCRAAASSSPLPWRRRPSPGACTRRSRPSGAARCASASTAPSPNRGWREASSVPSAPIPASPCCSFPDRRWRCSRRRATARSTPPSSTRRPPRTRSTSKGWCTTAARSRRANSSSSDRRRRKSAAACRRRCRAASRSLERLRTQAATDPASFVFLSANDGSGVHVAEQALWRAARIEPVAPWYVAADAGPAVHGAGARARRLRPGRARRLDGRRRRAARRPRRRRSAARRIGPCDAIVPGQPSGRQDLHRLDRRRPRPRGGRQARRLPGRAEARAWRFPAGC